LKGNVAGASPAVTTSIIAAIVRGLVFFFKTLVVIFVFMWVRWSLPRFRFDQLMMLAWRALIPISLGLLMMTAFVIYFWGPRMEPDLVVNGWLACVFLIANGLVLAATLLISTMLPPPPATNRKLPIPGSRFLRTPLPAR
jgi:NADH-quinone oxidoreductase subunit H